MKNSTFSAQVANNLLTLLQGYSKTIRLLLVMFLTLTVSANAWAADYELVSFSDIKTNDVIIIVGTKSSTAYAMQNTGTPPTPIEVTISNSKITSTATDITFTATNNGDNTITFVSTTSGTLYCTNSNNGVKIGDQTGNNTKFSFDSSVNRLKNIGQTRWLGIYNTQDWRCYTTASAANISGTTTTFYRKVTAAPSHTITATSNNNSYGTVSVSGTTITATPNDGYRVKSGDAGYTVTSGTAVVTNNGNNTFSVTPSSNCTITINFEAIPKYTVTWNVNGEVYETTQVSEGSKPTFPATPSSCDATSNTFYGWATATWDGKIDNISEKTIYTSANEMPEVNGAVTYYAVFAENSGGASFDGTTGGNFKIYAIVNGTKYYAKGTGSKISSTTEESDATEYTFAKTNTSFTIKTGTSYITYSSSTNLGTSATAYNWDISGGTNGSWRITSTASTSRGIIFRASTYNQFGGYSVGNASAGSTEYFDVEIGSSPSYSNYITSCTTEPSYSVTSTLSHVTGDAENATTINPEDEELLLSYSAESGWNLPDAISVTMGGNQLMLNDEYTWNKETGKVWILPANGFTGNIVVTINGWQQLAKPTGLNVASITSSGATLSWSAVANASSYTVQVYGENDEIIAEYTDLTQTTKEVSGLESDTYYIWAVTAIGDGTTYTDSDESETAEFTTSAVAPNTYTITFEANGGTRIDKITDATALPNPLPTTTRDHYTFAGWFTDEDCTQAATAGATINANTTLYAKWTPITYTVTFNAGSGTCATESTQGDFETGLELPTATPCDYASNNGWSFVGWSESSVSETTVRPAIHTGNYKPTKNITLHAVYAKTGTAQGGAGEFVLSLQYEGTTYYVGQTFDNSKLSAETNQANAALFTIEDNYLHYEGGYISHVATTSSPNITKQADKANAQAWTITEEANTIIFTSTADNTRGLGFNYNNGSPRFAAYQLSNADYPHTFTKTSVSDAAIDVTTYNSTPSCEAPVDPTWNAATINHSSIQVVCGSKTPLNAADPNGPATITFNGYDLQNSVTVTASQGFLVSTNKTEENTYKQEVTVNPYKDGQNIGKIQNVYVIAQAPAQSGDYDGTITLTGTDITDGSQTINVTAAVTCTQYTITWSVNGDDSHQVTYSPGGALQLPEIDITPCDGMDHVGWTDNMGYDHGTDILFTETTDMTVTSDKTYYAVFAASTSSDGDAETILYFTTQGYANQATVTSLTINAVTVTFSNGTNNNNPPKYYTSGTAVRVYGGNTFTVSSGNTISKIVITFGSSDGTNEITTDSGDYSDGTWTGSANEITFTIGGTSGNRRIASIAVTSAGGGASYYTGHTTTCSGSQQLGTPTNLQATDITYNGATLTWDAVAGANKYEVVINGTEYISNTNSYSTHDLKPQTAYTWTVQAIGNGTTFTDSEISAEATFTTGTALTITWSVSTNTTTTTITKGQPIGANLKTPATPAACEGKYFMGWSASSTVNSDGSDFTPITSDIVPETNVTYYAVFATKEVGDGVALTQCNGSTAFNAGDNIVIVASGADWSYLCYQETSGTTYIAYSDFTNDAATLIKDDKNYWTLETATNGFYLGDNTNGYMYIPTSNNLCVSTENKSTWTIDWNAETSAFNIKSDRWLSCRSDLSTTNQYKWRGGGTDGTSGTTNLQIYKISGSTSYTDYSTSCGTYTVTFYGFNSGGYTTTCDDNPAEIAVAQGETYQIPDCDPTFDPAGLGRTFAGTWNTQADGKGTTYEPGNEFIVNSDITLYAQWALNTSGNTTLPPDVEDLATTDIVVNGGHTLTLQAGTTTINSLTLKGGLLGEDSKSGYAMPSVVIPDNATLVRKNTTINLDLVVNSDSWYPFAVPFAVANNSNIDYLDPVLKAASTYNTHFAIKTYDGENRAIVGTDQENNWDKVLQAAGLQPGKGYIISALTYPDKDTATIRIPMTVSNEWLADGEQTTVNEVTRNTVAVTAYTGAAATEHQRHAGWNFVANPYLANFAGTNASGSFINGEIIINKGDYSYGGEDVPYVTIPTYNFAHYYQVKLSEATLSPAYSFFVQVGESGTMTFETAGRQAAPASIAARNAEERPVKMDVDITLSDNHSSDQTGIIISDRYSDAYEIGRDLEKLFGSAYNLSVYTLMADNTPLAFQALAIRSNMQVIPVGYRTPAQGEYTFRLNEATSSIDLLNEQYEQLVLVDYQTGELTNLLIADYTFYSERTQADNRFAIYAVPRQNAPTDLPNAIGQDKQAQKILHNGHLYILRDGNVYNGNGQIVK